MLEGLEELVFGNRRYEQFFVANKASCLSKMLYRFKEHMLFSLGTIEDLKSLFPQTVPDLHKLVESERSIVTSRIIALYSLQENEKNFYSMFLAFDKAQNSLHSLIILLHFFEMIYPLKHLKNAASGSINELVSYSMKAFNHPFSLYKALTDYAQLALKESLDKSEQSFIQFCLQRWIIEGRYLAPSRKELLISITDEINKNLSSFENNITQDNRMIHRLYKQLQGVPSDYIRYLNRAYDGCYILGPDVTILESASNESTRYGFWKMAVNRGYPANHKVLMTLIASRDKFSQVLGFTSFAQVDIYNQMAQNPEHVESFLMDIITRCHNRLPQEVELLKSTAQAQVTYTKHGKIKPWDLLFMKNYYKTKVVGIDEDTLSEYFPFEHVFDALLSLIQEFFSVTFKKVSQFAWWDPHVSVLELYQEGQLRGFIVLDLFARVGKYTAILEQPIIPPLITNERSNSLGLTSIIASFPPPLPGSPSLLSHFSVGSLFHEMGHAVHTLLAAQKIPSFAGTRVKKDFVEMPSQLLQKFLWQPSVLKSITAHYKTSEPLSDELIAALIHSRKFDRADLILEQCYFSMLSLEYYKEGAFKDIKALQRRLYHEIRPHLLYSEEDHTYAGFDHLGGYGAKYYGYLWSRALAYDVFNVVEEHVQQGGSLSSVGKRYVKEVISKGGSEDPWILLRNFLGREPSFNAFLQSIEE